jgi:hypothetical protein
MQVPYESMPRNDAPIQAAATTLPEAARAWRTGAASVTPTTGF